jgi:uncharacterized protein (UPF0332 family)
MAKAALKHEVEGQLVLLAEELRSFAANARAGTWRKATHNLYYAAFDATAALLWSKGIEPKSHDGAQSMLALHFVKPGALPADTTARLNELMAARNAADYKGAVPVGVTEAARYRPWVIGFVEKALALLEAGALKPDLAPVRAALSEAAAARLGKRGSAP